ncbi:RES domain-containing protein [Emticicia sp. CRIBPO]|uniref:RES family NAD+ phosphorylase n=1 Tax=Emticicia sp. CRIBPO TaxID=2683258 RepID=UPI001412C19B|nr:RES family NAD+ phosphorylase [Emticicia sp. CRIBPO]NBA87442.1 RES domain-containing protein [Emticicia sp. CRIBPO]
MIVYRLSKAKYSSDLSGRGAEKSGGRWNSKGVALVYTSQSRALCTAEIAVHTPLGLLPEGYELISIFIPDDASVLEMPFDKLPKDWKAFSHSRTTQQIGDVFAYERKHLVFKVPSVVVQGEFNYLINPDHRDFEDVRIESIEPFSFDERLFVRSLGI